MSVVRWSTPIALPDGVDIIDFWLAGREKYWDVPTSDFYIYEHVGGFWSVNLAGNRHKPGRPKAEDESITDWLLVGREPIDHPEAGQSYEFGELADAIACVQRLIGEGFLAPQWLLAAMMEELEAENGNAT